jgi:hypothetical protein
MINQDKIEATLWAIATWFSMRAAIQIWVTRSTINVYWPGWAFYALYESWKFVYYSHFDQWYSTAINCIMVSTNFVALAGVLRAQNKWPFKNFKEKQNAP